MSGSYEFFALWCSTPLSKIIASLSQTSDYNISANLLHFVLLACFSAILFVSYKFLTIKKHQKNIDSLGFKLGLIVLSICLLYLWLSAASQNSITPYIFPSYHRESIVLRSNSKDKVPQNFIVWRTEEAIKNFNKDFDWDEYKKLSFNEILNDGQFQIITLGNSLGYREGIPTEKIKYLSGIPRILGYAYGGPAYYDSFTHEIVIPKVDDYPASKYFYISTIIHELSHSLLFQRELDATLIQYKAMLNSKYPTIRALANFMWLEYTPFVRHPKFYDYLIESGIDQRFINEIINSRLKVKNRMKQLRIIQMIKSFMRSIDLKNEPSKYGWEPQKYSISPFYKVIYKWERSIWNSNQAITTKFVNKFQWSK